jgi:hypothetical protein
MYSVAFLENTVRQDNILKYQAYERERNYGT